MSRQRWYQDGLTFSCTQCGDCCRRPGDVRFSPTEADAVAWRLLGPTANADDLVGSLWSVDFDGHYRVEVVEGGACPFLSDNQCTIEDRKPIQCATYPFWSEVLESPALWGAEARYCEGIEREGSHYSRPDIDAIANERRRTSTDRSE
ncbi:MAG: Fe-S-cluster containining protein [Flavobacteriales bacterium]